MKSMKHKMLHQHQLHTSFINIQIHTVLVSSSVILQKAHKISMQTVHQEYSCVEINRAVIFLRCVYTENVLFISSL